jgi:hypothetical protein
MARISKQSLVTASPTRHIAGTSGRAERDATTYGPLVESHAVGQVVVLNVAGPLSDVVEDLDHAIRLALAQGPRGVACDMAGETARHSEPTSSVGT